MICSKKKNYEFRTPFSADAISETPIWGCASGGKLAAPDIAPLRILLLEVISRELVPEASFSQGPLNGGGFKRGRFPIWTCPSLFVLFRPFGDFPDFFGIFPICPGTLRGFSRFVLFLFLGLLTAPTRNSPERVCDTVWTFPEKSGKPPGLETPGFSFSQFSLAHSWTLCLIGCSVSLLALILCGVSFCP